MEIYEKYREELEKYREELENDNFEIEHDVLELQEKIEREIDGYEDERSNGQYSKLLLELKSLKKEFDFYDQEGELDMMFPNRHDEDFDDDSMSYDSVFGDD